MNTIVKCETCLYNRNCQFLATHKNAVIEGCTVYKNAADVVEVKHGKWINVQDFGGGKCFADCSICGTQEKAPNPTALKMFRRYCHYCGAKMDLKEGAEE